METFPLFSIVLEVRNYKLDQKLTITMDHALAISIQTTDFVCVFVWIAFVLGIDHLTSVTVEQFFACSKEILLFRNRYSKKRFEKE